MSNLHLSQEEWALLNDPQLLLLKNSILKKAEALLGQVAEKGQSALAAFFPDPSAALINTLPKISRGEQYKGLPYRILDFPRAFERAHVFACRILFWWGHSFTVMIHLKGQFQQRYGRAILDGTSRIPEAPWHIAMSGEEWDHDAQAYPLMASQEMRHWLSLTDDADFMKLYYPIPLTEWDRLPLLTERVYQMLGEAVRATDQLPSR